MLSSVLPDCVELGSNSITFFTLSFSLSYLLSPSQLLKSLFSLFSNNLPLAFSLLYTLLQLLCSGGTALLNTVCDTRIEFKSCS